MFNQAYPELWNLRMMTITFVLYNASLLTLGALKQYVAPIRAFHNSHSFLFQVSSSPLPASAILSTTGLATLQFARSGSPTQSSRPLSWRKSSSSTPTYRSRKGGSWRETWISQRGRSRYGSRTGEWRAKRTTKDSSRPLWQARATTSKDQQEMVQEQTVITEETTVAITITAGFTNDNSRYGRRQ